MKTIESQLRHQLKEQRMKSRQKEELFQADPWENSLQNGSMGESTYSSPDEFFSLDLNSSCTAAAMEKSANMEDSLVSTTSRFGGGGSSNLPQADTSHIHLPHTSGSAPFLLPPPRGAPDRHTLTPLAPSIVGGLYLERRPILWDTPFNVIHQHNFFFFKKRKKYTVQN